jgi:predicted XRE-type DNA-binding protein
MARENLQTPDSTAKKKINKLNRLIETLCGIYTRVARRMGVDRSFVSRVARGERHSKPVEDALVTEYKRVQNH